MSILGEFSGVLGDEAIEKVGSNLKFDISFLACNNVNVKGPLMDTCIAHYLCDSEDKHGLKYLLREVLGQEISKQQQSSDWGSTELTEAQTSYAAGDVLYLHALKVRLDTMLVREGRTELAAACFRFLPDRVRLDLAGFAAEDIFAHS